MNLRRRRLLVILGTAGRTWRQADRARRRAIVVVGRPVVAARGMWDGFVDWFNGLGLSENTILLAFAVAVGRRRRAGRGGLLQADRRRLQRCSTAGPGTFLAAIRLPGLSAAGDRRGVRGGLGHHAALRAGTRRAQRARRPARGGAPGRPDSRPPGARADGGERGHDRRRRLGRQRGPGRRAGLHLRLVAGPDLPLRVRAASRRWWAPARRRPSRRRSTRRSPGPSSRSRRSSARSRRARSPPVVVSSVLAAVVSRAVFGNHPAFPIPVEYGYTPRRARSCSSTRCSAS